MRRITPLLTLAIGLGAGATFGIVYAETQAEPAAYMIVTGSVTS